MNTRTSILALVALATVCVTTVAPNTAWGRGFGGGGPAGAHFGGAVGGGHFGGGFGGGQFGGGYQQMGWRHFGGYRPPYHPASRPWFAYRPYWQNRYQAGPVYAPPMPTYAPSYPQSQPSYVAAPAPTYPVAQPPEAPCPAQQQTYVPPQQQAYAPQQQDHEMQKMSPQQPVNYASTELQK